MDSINQLVGLQDIDLKLQELTELLGNLPEKVAVLVTEEEKSVSEIEEGKLRLKDIEVELAKAELEVNDYSGKIEVLKDQLNKVTSNRQYDALTIEIDYLKETIDKFETIDLELMEEKSILGETVSSNEANLSSISEDLRTRRRKLEKRISESAAKKAELEEKRKLQITELSQGILTKYNRTLEAKNGEAVMELLNDACGGCGSRVPPQIVVEVKTSQKIFNCDTCGRFLYWAK